ncbi:MAG: hypothetical protein M3443_04505 [Actinomycetota bacterium]|nr:hypothetical protein [Actinomycetota bacterium]
MKTVAMTAAACALLAALTSCGSPAASEPVSASAGGLSDSRRSGGLATRGDDRIALADGLFLTISAPKTFVPSDSAEPRARRAVGFEMTLDNDSATNYQPTLLSLTVVADGVEAQRVVDSTQGYTGVVGAAELAPGDGVRFSVAFGVPQETSIRLTAQPYRKTTPAVTVYEGVI